LIRKLRERLGQAESSIVQLLEESNRLKETLSAQAQPQPQREDSRQQIIALEEEIRKLTAEKQVNFEQLK
jgi:hypothetical protein